MEGNIESKFSKQNLYATNSFFKKDKKDIIALMSHVKMRMMQVMGMVPKLHRCYYSSKFKNELPPELVYMQLLFSFYPSRKILSLFPVKMGRAYSTLRCPRRTSILPRWYQNISRGVKALFFDTPDRWTDFGLFPKNLLIKLDGMMWPLLIFQI